jgi:hypothetical protein
MTMETRTIIDRIEIDVQTGNVGVRMRKQILDDQGHVLANDYHRTMIDAATDSAKQMEAVNAHLATMGFPAVRASDHKVLTDVMPTLETLRAQKVEESKSDVITRSGIRG